MSNTQFAFLDRESVPNRDQLQKTIDDLGFDLQLDPEFTPFYDEGFSPCVLNGESEVGFEIYYEPSKDVVQDGDEFKAIANGKSYCISMCWGGRLKDCACVMIVSCALSKNFDAIISYEGEDPEPLEKMISDVEDILEQTNIEELKQQEAAIAIENAKKDGNFKEIAESILSSVAGTTVSNIALYGSIAVPFSNGAMIRAKAFSFVLHSGEIIDLTKYARIRSKQAALVFSATEGESSPELEAEINSLEEQLNRAAESDEANAEKFIKELESWPEELIVTFASWPESNVVILEFSNVPSGHLKLEAFDSMFADITIKSDVLEFKVSPDRCEIVG